MKSLNSPNIYKFYAEKNELKKSWAEKNNKNVFKGTKTKMPTDMKLQYVMG